MDVPAVTSGMAARQCPSFPRRLPVYEASFSNSMRFLALMRPKRFSATARSVVLAALVELCKLVGGELSRLS
jgi:hypothetical protein